MGDNRVDPIESHEEVGVLPKKTVVLRASMAGKRWLLEMEGRLEVLDGGDGDLVGGVHGHALAEADEDALQLLVHVDGFGEVGAEQVPSLRHAHHLQAEEEQ